MLVYQAIEGARALKALLDDVAQHEVLSEFANRRFLIGVPDWKSEVRIVGNSEQFLSQMGTFIDRFAELEERHFVTPEMRTAIAHKA